MTKNKISRFKELLGLNEKGQLETAEQNVEFCELALELGCANLNDTQTIQYLSNLERHHD